jgi:hypothetical protein
MNRLRLSPPSGNFNPCTNTPMSPAGSPGKPSAAW